MNKFLKLSVASACIAFSSFAMAEDVATLVNLVGNVSFVKADGSTVAVKVKDKVQEGDTLVTAKGAYAMFKFIDGGEMILRPDSQVKVAQFKFVETQPLQDKAEFNLIKGGLRRLTGLVGKRGDKDADKLVAATATAGIRGTIYDTLQCNNDCGKLPNGLYFKVKEGEIVVKNEAGEIGVKAGKYASVPSAGSAPVLLPKDPGLPLFNPPKSMQKDSGSCAASA